MHRMLDQIPYCFHFGQRSLCQDINPRTFSIHRLFICKISKSHIWQDLGEYQCIFTEFPFWFPVEDRLHFSSSRGYIWLTKYLFPKFGFQIQTKTTSSRTHIGFLSSLCYFLTTYIHEMKYRQFPGNFIQLIHKMKCR